MGAQGEERLGEGALLHQVEDGQQSAEPSVAVEEEVDGLELVVHQGTAHQHGRAHVLVQVPLEVVGQHPGGGSGTARPSERFVVQPGLSFKSTW